MFYRSGFNLKLTRGDNASLSVDLKNLDGTQYEREEGDQLVLTVKRDANTEEAQIQLSAHPDTTFYNTPSAPDDKD